MAFSISPFAQVIFCGFFSSGSDWVSTVQKQATFTGVTEHWNRKPMVLWSGYLAWKPLPQSENIRAAGQSLLKQLFTQIPRRFVSGIATTATFVCGQRSRGGCQYPLPATSPVSLAKFPYCLGSMQWFQGVRIFAYQSNLNICKKKMFAWEKRIPLGLGSNCLNIVKAFVISWRLFSEHCLSWVSGVKWESKILQILCDNTCFAWWWRFKVHAYIGKETEKMP